MLTAKPFTAADLVRTINSCKMSQPPIPERPQPVKSSVDWQSRKQEKWSVFSRFSKYLAAIVVASLVCLVLPLWLANEALGEAFLISIPPMLLVSFSWMAGMWKFFDDHNILLIATVGMIPIRMAVVVAFTLALALYSDVLIGALVIGMIIHWALFAVPEMLMMHRFEKQFA